MIERGFQRVRFATRKGCPAWGQLSPQACDKAVSMQAMRWMLVWHSQHTARCFERGSGHMKKSFAHLVVIPGMEHAGRCFVLAIGPVHGSQVACTLVRLTC
jgi:hypothetical protein